MSLLSISSFEINLLYFTDLILLFYYYFNQIVYGKIDDSLKRVYVK